MNSKMLSLSLSLSSVLILAACSDNLESFDSRDNQLASIEIIRQVSNELENNDFNVDLKNQDFVEGDFVLNAEIPLKDPKDQSNKSNSKSPNEARFLRYTDTDEMTDEVYETYFATSNGFRFSFFCDQDGLNFSFGYDYMMYEEGTRLEYRIGDSPLESARPELVSTDGEHVYFYGQSAVPFLTAIVNGLVNDQTVLVRFYERVNGSHTFSLEGTEQILELDCVAPFYNNNSTEEVNPSNLLEEPLKMSAEKSDDY